MSKILTQIHETLVQFGFSKNETKIIIALTKNGAMTILEVSNSTDIARTSIYNYIQTLQRRGIVAMVIIDYTKKYQIIDPAELENCLINRNHSAIQKSIELLKSVQDTKDQSNEIIITNGLNALKKVYEKILTYKNNYEYMIKGGDYESWIAIDKEFFGQFEVLRAVKFPRIRAIFNPTTKINNLHNKTTANNTSIKTLPTDKTLLTNAILVDGVKIVHELKPPYKCIVIKNEFLFEMEKQEFEILWKVL